MIFVNSDEHELKTHCTWVHTYVENRANLGSILQNKSNFIYLTKCLFVTVKITF